MDVGSRRAMTLAVETPSDEVLGAVASGEMWAEIYESRRRKDPRQPDDAGVLLVPTRRMSERVTFALTQRLGEDVVMPHHGKAWPKRPASRPKTGSRAANCGRSIATASLEAPGIDIGFIDLVVQLGTPRSIATALQRIGRSAPLGRRDAAGRAVRDHARRAARVRGAGARLARRRDGRAPHSQRTARHPRTANRRRLRRPRVERRRVLHDVVRGTYPYRDLTRSDFDDVVSLVADGVATSRGRSGTFLHYDRVNGVLRARRGARISAITNGGAIPETALYSVIAEPDGIWSARSTRISPSRVWPATSSCSGRRPGRSGGSKAGTVRVEDAHGAPPTIPFATARTRRRSSCVRTKRRPCAAPLTAATTMPPASHLMDECALDESGADQAVAYVRAAKAGLGVVPTCDTIVAERFFDEGGGMQLHPPHAVRRAHQSRVGVSRCASASVSRSTSNCRPRPPTTASSFRWPSSTRFRSKRSSST